MRIRTVPQESRRSRDNRYVGASMEQAEIRGKSDRAKGWGFTRCPYASLDKQRAWERGWEKQDRIMHRV